MIITLEEILDRLVRTAARIELFGVTIEFEAVYEARLTRLNEAICAEMGIRNSDGDDPMSLPEETEFNSMRVIHAFERLCEWLDSRRQEITPASDATSAASSK